MVVPPRVSVLEHSTREVPLAVYGKFNVTPAQAGVQARPQLKCSMVSGFRRKDEYVIDTLLRRLAC